MEQFDVSNAFLNGTLDEDVYINAPEGVKVRSGECLKLEKALYGLRQAPRVWNSLFERTIRAIGFEVYPIDSCVYANMTRDVFVVLHVDDGLIIGRQKESCTELLAKLDQKFPTTLILSSVGAEYIAVSETARDIKWLTTFLEWTKLKPVSATLFIDNKAAISLTSNEAINNRSNNIEVHYYFIRKSYSRSCSS